MKAVNWQQKQRDHAGRPFLVHKNEQRYNGVRNPEIWKTKVEEEMK